MPSASFFTSTAASRSRDAAARPSSSSGPSHHQPRASGTPTPSLGSLSSIEPSGPRPHGGGGNVSAQRRTTPMNRSGSSAAQASRSNSARRSNTNSSSVVDRARRRTPTTGARRERLTAPLVDGGSDTEVSDVMDRDDDRRYDHHHQGGVDRERDHTSAAGGGGGGGASGGGAHYTQQLLAREIDLLKENLSDARVEAEAERERATLAEADAERWRRKHAEACRTAARLEIEVRELRLILREGGAATAAAADRVNSSHTVEQRRSASVASTQPPPPAEPSVASSTAVAPSAASQAPGTVSHQHSGVGAAASPSVSADELHAMRAALEAMRAELTLLRRRQDESDHASAAAHPLRQQEVRAATSAASPDFQSPDTDQRASRGSSRAAAGQPIAGGAYHPRGSAGNRTASVVTGVAVSPTGALELSPPTPAPGGDEAPRSHRLGASSSTTHRVGRGGPFTAEEEGDPVAAARAERSGRLSPRLHDSMDDAAFDQTAVDVPGTPADYLSPQSAGVRSPPAVTRRAAADEPTTTTDAKSLELSALRGEVHALRDELRRASHQRDSPPPPPPHAESDHALLKHVASTVDRLQAASSSPPPPPDDDGGEAAARLTELDDHNPRNAAASPGRAAEWPPQQRTPSPHKARGRDGAGAFEAAHPALGVRHERSPHRAAATTESLEQPQATPSLRPSRTPAVATPLSRSSPQHMPSPEGAGYHHHLSHVSPYHVAADPPPPAGPELQPHAQQQPHDAPRFDARSAPQSASPAPATAAMPSLVYRHEAGPGQSGNSEGGGGGLVRSPTGDPTTPGDAQQKPPPSPAGFRPSIFDQPPAAAAPPPPPQQQQPAVSATGGGNADAAESWGRYFAGEGAPNPTALSTPPSARKNTLAGAPTGDAPPAAGAAREHPMRTDMMNIPTVVSMRSNDPTASVAPAVGNSPTPGVVQPPAAAAPPTAAFVLADGASSSRFSAGPRSPQPSSSRVTSALPAAASPPMTTPAAPGSQVTPSAGGAAPAARSANSIASGARARLARMRNAQALAAAEGANDSSAPAVQID